MQSSGVEPAAFPEVTNAKPEFPVKGPNRVGSVNERSISHQDSTGSPDISNAPDGSRLRFSSEKTTPYYYTSKVR